MTLHIALLRGINLGRHRRVAMADLRKMLTELGYGDVRTYLQSGNVLLTSKAKPERLAGELEEQLAAALGLPIRVMVRSGDELADVVRRDPLGAVVTDPKRYQVSFLSAAPDPDVLAGVSPADVAPEQFVLSGREIFTWHPDGVQNSILLKLLTERRLGVAATARNWRTVTKLAELAGY